MGSIEVKSQQKQQKDILSPATITKLDLKVDLKKQILPQIQQLTHWSFQQIKQVYTKYQRRSQCPFIDSYITYKILPFNKPTAQMIFQYFSEFTKFISIYELLCTLVLFAHHSFKKKLQLIYIIFNFGQKPEISMKQLILMFQSFVYGFCKATGQKRPEYIDLMNYANEHFLKGNVNFLDKPVKLRRLLDQVQGSEQIAGLFNRFQHSEYLKFKEEHNLYSEKSFQKICSQDVEKNYRIFMKVYKNSDYEQVNLFEYNRQLRVQNRRLKAFKSQDNSLIKTKQSATNLHKKKNKSKQGKSKSPKRFKSTSKISRNSLPAIASSQLKQTKNPQQIGKLTKFNSTMASKNLITNSSLNNHNNSTSLSKQLQKTKYLFLKGSLVTKRNVFDTISYFRNLSNNQDEIGIKQFFKSFENKAFMKKQLSSLFRIIDRNSNGQISFQQFLQIMYPGITSRDIEIVKLWKDQYMKIYYSDSLEQMNILENKVKNQKPSSTGQILPNSSLNRMKQIFKLIDREQKGYISFIDLTEAFKYKFTMSEIQNLIKQYGKNDKIELNGLVKMLLPYGWTIEGYKIQ